MTAHYIGLERTCYGLLISLACSWRGKCIQRSPDLDHNTKPSAVNVQGTCASMLHDHEHRGTTSLLWSLCTCLMGSDSKKIQTYTPLTFAPMEHVVSWSHDGAIFSVGEDSLLQVLLVKSLNISHGFLIEFFPQTLIEMRKSLYMAIAWGASCLYLVKLCTAQFVYDPAIDSAAWRSYGGMTSVSYYGKPVQLVPE